MKIKRYITGPIQVNTYLVYDETSKEAMLIDVGGAANEIASDVKKLELNVKGIYNTHGHFDHILGAKDVQELLNCGFYVNEKDALFVENLLSQLNFYGMDAVMPPKITGYIDKNTELSLGDCQIKIIETPGHTPGGVCFLVDDMLFSGDTLFLESIGRTDLPGGDYSTLTTSIKENLFTLPENIKVFPGHDDATSIEHEKKYNMMV